MVLNKKKLNYNILKFIMPILKQIQNPQDRDVVIIRKKFNKFLLCKIKFFYL